MPPSRHIRLTQDQDAQLREIEQDPYLKPKVRLRAQVLRLSNRGSNMEEIASYTGRSPASIARDFDRWRERGVEGLADGTAPGNPPLITEEAKTFMRGKLSEERTWNATQLAEVSRRVRARGHAGGRSPAPARDGLLVETHPLRAQQTAGPRGGAQGQGGVGRAEKGAQKARSS